MQPLLPLGSTFAGYRIEAVVGWGGMGTVYRARQLVPNRHVALKLISRELAPDPVAQARFLREIELLAALEHPHIVPVHAAGEAEGQLYLAMRYLDGPNLGQLVRDQGPLSVGRTLSVLAPIADALDAAHERGLIHRDVSPGNVLMDARGDTYLSDFGLSRRAVSTTGPVGGSGRRAGTLDYIAPEELTGRPLSTELAGRRDLYALGCLLYLCLTGEPPFRRSTDEATIWAHLQAEPPRPTDRRPGLPWSLDAVVATALAKNPEQRFPSGRVLIDAVRAAAPEAGLAGADDLTLPAAAVRTRSRWIRAHGSLRGAAGSLALVGMLLLTGGALGYGLIPVVGGGGQPTAGPSAGATARQSPSPTPKPSPTPTPTPTPTPFGASADVSRLRAWLPDSIRADCRSAPLNGSREVAAVSCSRRDLIEVRYALYPDPGTLSTAWQRFVESRNLGTRRGSCAAGEEFAGAWSTNGFFGLTGRSSGRLACFVGPEGTARVEWTLDGSPVWSSIRRSDEDIAAAYAAWRADDLTPRPPN